MLSRSYLFVAILLAGKCVGQPLEVAGLSRLNPSGLDHTWAYEEIAFYALSKIETLPDAVQVVRLQHPIRGFFLTTSQSEVNHAMQSGYTRQGVAFYAPRKSVWPVFRFTQKNGEEYFYSTKISDTRSKKWVNEGVSFYSAVPTRAAFKKFGKVLAKSSAVPVFRYRNSDSGHYLFTAGRESPYQVGAYYFGSYTPESKRVIDGTSRVYGREGDWWGGVVDFYGKQPGVPADNRGWAGNWSGLKPAIGYYNQQSTNTLRKHILQATDAGLSFFSFYWYWSKERKGELFFDALQSFLRANTDGLFKFNLSFYSHPWDDDMAIDEDNFKEVVDAIVGYFLLPGYLRLPDGRPVFVMGDHRNIRGNGHKKCSDAECYVNNTDRFLHLLRVTSMERLGVSPFVQIQAGAPGWDTVREIDGTTCLIPPIKLANGAQYPQLNQAIFEPLRGARRPVSPCMLADFDERPRQDILIKNRDAVNFFLGKSDTLFRHNLEVAKKFADEEFTKTADPSTHIIYLYAWNEWHEGGVLEPNVETGAKDLNIVTDVFQLPRNRSQCLDKGLCQ